jgi:hypothetical protein
MECIVTINILQVYLTGPESRLDSELDRAQPSVRQFPRYVRLPCRQLSTITLKLDDVTLSHLLPVLGLGLDLSGLGLRGGRGVLILWTASNGSSAYNTDHVRLGDQLAARRITDDMGRCNLQLLTGHLDVK